jgi:putative FmdB family regulatory protein
MPVYEIQCLNCGKHEDVFRRIAEMNDLPECCGTPMSRCLSAPSVMADIQPYRSMATGEMITSRTQHRNHLKSRGLVEIGDQHESHQKQMDQRKEDQKKAEGVRLRQEIAARLDTATK